MFFTSLVPNIFLFFALLKVDFRIKISKADSSSGSNVEILTSPLSIQAIG
jgi:hypothetical protein